MPKTKTAKLSSKGEIVIPEEIRESLGLRTGDEFVVVEEKGFVILKAISVPGMRDFDSLIAQARTQARRAAMKRSDIPSLNRGGSSRASRSCVRRSRR